MAEGNEDVSSDSLGDFGLRKRLVNPSDASPTISGERPNDDKSEWYQDVEDRYKPEIVRKPSKQFGGARSAIFEDQVDERKFPQKSKKGVKDIYIPFVHLRSRESDTQRLRERSSTSSAERILKKKGWTTADTIRHEETGAYIIFTIRDFVIYAVFLILVCTVTYGAKENAHNHYASVTQQGLTDTNFKSYLGEREIIGNFHEIHAPGQIFPYCNQILLFFVGYLSRPLSENKLIGAAGLRQIRVKNNTCSTAPMFQDVYVTCYDYYTAENEEKGNFGNVHSSAWQYKHGIHSSSTDGHMGYYGGGGYLLNMSRDIVFDTTWMRELESQTWIRLGTRAVILETTLVAPNTKLFLTVKLLFELLPTGGVATKTYITVLDLLRYSNAWELFILSCELMIVAFTIYFTFEELQQIFILREDYLSNWWNILDVTVLFLSYSTIFLGIMQCYTVITTLKQKLDLMSTNVHIDFDELVQIEKAYMLSMSLFTFAAWLKLFKFTSLHRSVTLMMSAFGKIKGELLMAVIMSFVILSGFALFGLCLFGSHVKHFHGYPKALISLIFMYAGSFEFYDGCKKAYPTLAPIYFSVYILITVVVFFALFVALIVLGYHRADVSMQQHPDSPFFSDLIWSLFIAILGFLGQFEYIQTLQEKEILSQNIEDYDAFVTALRRHGWKNREINLFMNTYKVVRGDKLKLSRMVEMYNDFCLRNMLFIEVEGHKEIHDQLDKVNKMIEFCDQALVDIMSKVDYLIVRTTKSNRKAATSNVRF